MEDLDEALLAKAMDVVVGAQSPAIDVEKHYASVWPYSYKEAQAKLSSLQQPNLQQPLKHNTSPVDDLNTTTTLMMKIKTQLPNYIWTITHKYKTTGVYSNSMVGMSQLIGYSLTPVP